jgi:ribosomal protein S1
MRDDLKNIWREIEEKFPVDSIVIGVVEYHQPFGIFVNIGSTKVKGLVPIIDFLDEGVMTPGMYPTIGSTIEAVVLGHTLDESMQVYLSVKPSKLRDSR